MANDKVNKVVLAYSGGLDTSVILKWLQETYRCEVITFTADLGQGEDIEPARKKAELLGIKQIFIEDLREEFVSDYVFPMFRANALYEGLYLLGTSIARPLIAKRQIEIAREIVKSLDWNRGVHFNWDAKFIDSIGENKQELYDIILAANYMDINSLLHLGCAKVASLIKGQPLDKIKDILC